MKPRDDETALHSHFEFGKNWAKLIDRITEDHVQSAAQDIASFTQRPNLKGLSFLDIGCGSGLSSLAAFRLGAEPIISVDIDPENIRNLAALKSKFGVPQSAAWMGSTASILDADATTKLPKADIVYSWGVLHHTGDMWRALDNCTKLVKPQGLLYIMLYRDSLLGPLWKRIKWFYTKAPSPVRAVMTTSFATLMFLGWVLKGRNPVKIIREYPKKSRGMEWYIDVVDWVGGYPYEYATLEEVKTFLGARGFELVNVDPQPDNRAAIGIIGLNFRYLFRLAQP